MTLLKHKATGQLFDLCEPATNECRDGEIAVYPHGGGFQYKGEAIDFEETEMPTNTTTGWASLDGDEYIYKCEYNPHEKWNGWDEPSFTRAVLEEIAENWMMTIVKDDDGGEYMVEEGRDICDGIFIREIDGRWDMSGVCWSCGTDEEVAEDEERYDVSYKRVK